MACCFDILCADLDDDAQLKAATSLIHDTKHYGALLLPPTTAAHGASHGGHISPLKPEAHLIIISNPRRQMMRSSRMPSAAADAGANKIYSIFKSQR